MPIGAGGASGPNCQASPPCPSGTTRGALSWNLRGMYCVQRCGGCRPWRARGGARGSRAPAATAPSASTGRWIFAWRELALLDLAHQPLDPVVAPEALALVDEEGKAEDLVGSGIRVAPLERRLVVGLPEGGEELGAGETGSLGDLGQRLLLPDVPGLEPAGAVHAVVVRGTPSLLVREEEAAAGLLAVGERAGVER